MLYIVVYKCMYVWVYVFMDSLFLKFGVIFFYFLLDFILIIFWGIYIFIVEDFFQYCFQKLLVVEGNILFEGYFVEYLFDFCVVF